MPVLANPERVDKHRSVGHRTGQAQAVVSCRLTEPTLNEYGLRNRSRRGQRLMLLEPASLSHKPLSMSADAALGFLSREGSRLVRLLGGQGGIHHHPRGAKTALAAVHETGKIDIVPFLMRLPSKPKDKGRHEMPRMPTQMSTRTPLQPSLAEIKKHSNQMSSPRAADD